LCEINKKGEKKAEFIGFDDGDGASKRYAKTLIVD
jgi:hypothetical protein